jgi:isoquinoline 1-oxidoreductase subunit alpha
MTSMTVNGEAVRFHLDPATPLLWALRDAANLTGAKYGCDSGDCGACTVIVDERAVPSCTVTIGSLEGAEVVTIEGLSSGRAHPVQQAWAAEQVSQCGYCDPGMILAIAALLKASPRPSEAEIAALPNICRCGTGPRVRKAIDRASLAMTGGEPLAAPPRPPESAEQDKSVRFSNGSASEEQTSPQ